MNLIANVCKVILMAFIFGTASAAFATDYIVDCEVGATHQTSVVSSVPQTNGPGVAFPTPGHIVVGDFSFDVRIDGSQGGDGTLSEVKITYKTQPEAPLIILHPSKFASNGPDFGPPLKFARLNFVTVDLDLGGQTYSDVGCSSAIKTK